MYLSTTGTRHTLIFGGGGSDGAWGGGRDGGGGVGGWVGGCLSSITCQMVTLDAPTRAIEYSKVVESSCILSLGDASSDHQAESPDVEGGGGGGEG